MESVRRFGPFITTTTADVKAIELAERCENFSRTFRSERGFPELVALLTLVWVEFGWKLCLGALRDEVWGERLALTFPGVGAEVASAGMSDVVDCEIEDFQGGVIGWDRTPSFGDFANLFWWALWRRSILDSETVGSR